MPNPADNFPDDPERFAALGDRLADAQQAWRYFCRRDEMNAEVHLVDAQDGVPASVRYSPVTIASERVVNYLGRMLYGDNYSWGKIPRGPQSGE